MIAWILAFVLNASVIIGLGDDGIAGGDFLIDCSCQVILPDYGLTRVTRNGTTYRIRFVDLNRQAEGTEPVLMVIVGEVDSISVNRLDDDNGNIAQWRWIE